MRRQVDNQSISSVASGDYFSNRDEGVSSGASVRSTSSLQSKLKGFKYSVSELWICGGRRKAVEGEGCFAGIADAFGRGS